MQLSTPFREVYFQQSIAAGADATITFNPKAPGRLRRVTFEDTANIADILVTEVSMGGDDGILDKDTAIAGVPADLYFRTFGTDQRGWEPAEHSAQPYPICTRTKPARFKVNNTNAGAIVVKGMAYFDAVPLGE